MKNVELIGTKRETKGTTTDDAQRLAELEREVRELRRANEMADSSGQRNESCEMRH